MNASNPYELFSPIHPAWLYRGHAKKLDVTAADLKSIEKHYPQVADDPLFAEYRARAAAGKLYRRRGRKPKSSLDYLRLWQAHFSIEEEKKRIWTLRRSGVCRRKPYEQAPIHQAAELVARQMRFGTGRALLNRLSLERIR
jgi:hypothetical protein